MISQTLRKQHKYRGILNARAMALGIAMAAWICVAWMPDSALADDKTTCLSASGPTAVSACRNALRKDPSNSDIRIALGEALMKMRRYGPAVDVFKAGLEMEPGNKAYKEQLALAESLLKEQAWIQKQQKQRDKQTAGGRNGKKSIAANRFILRCTKLKGDTALAACNEGLSLYPGLAELYRGKGNALMDLGRNGEAITAYRDALVLAPDHRDTKLKLSMAQSRRRVSVQKCTQLTGINALSACDAALIQGSPDELVIQQRRGDLLSALGRKQAAIEAYQAALRIDADNSTIQSKLAALEGIDQASLPSESPAIVESAPEKATVVAAVDKKPKLPAPPAKKSVPPIKTVPSPPKSNAPSPGTALPLPAKASQHTQTAVSQPAEVEQAQRSTQSLIEKKALLPMPAKLPVPEKDVPQNTSHEVARIYSNGPVAEGVTH